MRKNKISLTEATMLALQGKLNLQESVDVSIQDDGLTMVDTDDKIITVQDKVDTLPEEEIITEPVEGVIPKECEDCTEEVIPEETSEEVIEVPVEGEETIIPEEEVSEETLEDILDESKEIKTEANGTDDAVEAILGFHVDGDEGKLDEDWLLNDIELQIQNTESLANGVTNTRRPAHSVAYDGLMTSINSKANRRLTSPQIQAGFKKLGIDFKELLKPVVDHIKEIRKDTENESKEVKTEDYTPDITDKVIMTCENGDLDWETVARECLQSMPVEDVENMVRICEWKLDGEELEESKEVEIKIEVEADEGTDVNVTTEESEEEDVPEVESEVENEGIEPEEEVVDEAKEQIKQFSSRTFNEALTRFYKKQYKAVESFKLTKLLHSQNTLKIEGKLLNRDNIGKDVSLNLVKVQEGKSFVKYTLNNTEKALIKESKDSATTLNMMTSIDNGVLKCKYLLNK